MRVLAVLLLFAVLPTVELGEQVAHVLEHLIEGDAPDHSAHHEELPGDEHGCTGLIHLCSCHHAQVTAAVVLLEVSTIETPATIAILDPSNLVDLHTLEPPHRPPIN